MGMNFISTRIHFFGTFKELERTLSTRVDFHNISETFMFLPARNGLCKFGFQLNGLILAMAALCQF